MLSDEFRQFIKVVDDNSKEDSHENLEKENFGEDLERWNAYVKKMLGSDAYITKEKDGYNGVKYRVYARFYPAAILGLKGEDTDPAKAIEKARITIERHGNNNVKAPIKPKYEEGW
jgi:hypothetical protein